MATTYRTTTTVDTTALKVTQALIIALVAIAFVVGPPAGAWLVAFVGLSLAVGAIRPGYWPFQLLYCRALRPAGLLRPNPRPDDPVPHRFAQAVGATFLVLAAMALFAGSSALGWALAWLVVALALVNLLVGFCAGCFAFYQLRRLARRGGVPA